MSGAGRGMTMVETLAATLVLAATAASTVAALRDARAASARAALMREALAAMERWSQEAGDAVDIVDAAPWRWTDERGRAWSVRAEPATPTTAPAGVAGTDEPRLDVVWVAVVVETTDNAGAPVVALTRLRPFVAPSEARAAGGGER